MDVKKTGLCPDEERLEAYAAGACAAEEAAAIAAHLEEGCAHCRQWIEDAQANEQVFPSVQRVLRRSNGIRGGNGNPADPGGAPWIEGYEILGEVGRGGMGVVYKARQCGTKRTVALKVLLEGPLASDSARRRFEREIELAASLSHPNIVAIHDSGLSQGRYYFAMDYIEGQRLDHYARDRQLPEKDRLALMQKVCQAVNYAHQRGVIHRDLKPSNILVDDAGEPHILDFGLAKTVGSPPGESLLLSISGEVLGTLPYMAPEQAMGLPAEIDCRTDVYALGVIFYELLTGRYPYPVAGQMAEVLRNIAEAEPARPSTIYRKIKHDLETIVLKTLAKEKESRYESAGALAADIGRYVAGEAIEAKRDSGWYVFRKTLRRYKWPAGIAAGFVLLVAAAAVATSWLYARAEQQRQRADAQAQQAEAARAQAEQSARQLADEMVVRAIEEGRSLAAAGDVTQAESVLWREFLQRPGDPYALWALRELYAQVPSVGKVQASYAPVTSIAFDTAGRTLISGDLEGVVKVWEMPACRHAATVITQAPDIISLALSPDGGRLVCLSSDRTVRLLDLTSRRVAGTWYVGQESAETSERPSPAIAAQRLEGVNCRPAQQIAFAPDGQTFAVCAAETVHVWNTAAGQLVRTLRGHTDPVTAVAYSADGGTIATGGQDRQVILWDAQTGQRRTGLRGHLDTVSCVAFRGDGEVVASTSWDGSAILWAARTGQLLASLDGFDCWVHSVAFSPDGTTLATGDIHGQIRLWDLASGQCIAAIPAHVEGMGEPLRPAVALAYSPDGQVLASASVTGVLKLWDTDRSRDMLKLAGEGTTVLATAFEPAGQLVAGRETDGTVRLWDLASGACVRTLEEGKGAAASWPVGEWDDPELAGWQDSLAFSPDGRMVAAADGEAVTLWDTQTGRRIGGFDEGGAAAVVFGPDGRTLATGGRDGRVRLYDVATGEVGCVLEAIGQDPVQERSGTKQGIRGLALSPDEHILACGVDNVVQLWDVQTRQKTSELKGHSAAVWSVAFSADGTRLVSAGGDGAIVWETKSGRCVRRLDTAGPAYSAAFSPDGATVATSGPNRTLRLWQETSGRCLATLLADGGRAWSVRFDRSGQLLACGGGGGLRVWDLERYDRCVLGNYAFHFELAQASEELAGKVNRDDVDRWAAGSKGRASGIGGETTGAGTTTAGGERGAGLVEVEAIAAWGRFTRLRMLMALGEVASGSPDAMPAVAGAMDPPARALRFYAGAGDRKVVTLPDAGYSAERSRSAVYQQQRRGLAGQ